MLQRLGQYLLANRLTSIALLLMLASAHLLGIPFLFSCALIILALVVLRLGPVAGLGGLAAVLLPVFYEILTAGHLTWPTIAFLLESALVWVVASLLCLTMSWSKAIQYAAIIAVAVVVLMHVMLAVDQAQSMPVMTSVLGDALRRSGKLSQLQVKLVLRVVSHYMPALYVAASMLSALIIVVVARAWQSYLFNPMGFYKEIVHVRIGIYFTCLFLGIILFSLMGPIWVQKMAIVMVVPFIMGGMCVTHAMLMKWIHKNQFSRTIMVGFYVLLLLFLNITMIAMMFIGVLDGLCDFRKLQQRGSINQ